MVIDTSAIVAILFNEPERAVFRSAIESASRRPLLSAMTLLERSLVVGGQRGVRMLAVLDALVEETMDVIALDEATLRVARDAFMLYGKGRHPGGSEPRRLRRLRAGEDPRQAAVVQGQRFRSYRYCAELTPSPLGHQDTNR